MKHSKNAMKELSKSLNKEKNNILVPFDEFLEHASKEPQTVFRNTFQLFSDFINHYIKAKTDEDPNDPESINFIDYDCSKLLVDGTTNPFFADRLFANKLVDIANSLKLGAQQNKKYLFEGPHGSGKSTFLNNLLSKLEDYTRAPEGEMYETVWCLDKNKIKGQGIEELLKESDAGKAHKKGNHSDYLEVPCPSHDYPLLMIPKDHRKNFLGKLIKDGEFKEKLFHDKEYDWVFNWEPCTICTSLYDALLSKLNSPEEVFNMLFARKNHFNRRLGEGISVFNAGDMPERNNIMTNDVIQKQLAELFGDSNKVKYYFSRYARTNNGIYALMDIKDHNQLRLKNLHGVISEGVHKVDNLEENIRSLFISVINPEDKIEINNKKMKAFADRLEYINLPYVLAYNTEVEILKSIFGKDIEKKFIPRVLKNFSKVIISTRLSKESRVLKEWIKQPRKYSNYCSKDLLLLKMDLYTGHIPQWLSEEDRKRFTAKRRRNLLKNSEREGFKGVSGREAVDLFKEFYSTYNKGDRMIDMSMVQDFFSKKREYHDKIPSGFLDSLVNLYDYNLMQEIKDSLYHYNEERLSRDVQNYLFALSLDLQEEDEESFEKVKCPYTGDMIERKEEPLFEFELSLFDKSVTTIDEIDDFRRNITTEYVTKTISQEMNIEGKEITETTLYKDLYRRYVQTIKENVFDQFKDTDNFRNAIKDFKTNKFSTYSTRVKEDVEFLIDNLQEKYGYNETGARQVSIYALDKGIMDYF